MNFVYFFIRYVNQESFFKWDFRTKDVDILKKFYRGDLGET
ncbi:hypothetical protein EH11_04194 [Bacillus subtilis]|nr:hypothetical protein EH11_04194 [Bacillus subtilis]RPK10630.1 hypothetical protein EH5_03468 [Bacillus subtilis]RUS03551.1 hypothetical protein EFW59_04148 [Bacillus subtilis]